MPSIDDILPLIGTPLDERSIQALFGEVGRRSSDELDDGHPEDQLHYYEIPAYSVEMILGDGETIQTIFFHLRGKQAGYPWALQRRGPDVVQDNGSRRDGSTGTFREA